MIEKITELSKSQIDMLKQLLSEPITVFLKEKKKEISDLITANSQVIGVGFLAN